jgi:hypothetical protein
VKKSMIMASNYKKYLAERVLNEQEHVSDIQSILGATC